MFIMSNTRRALPTKNPLCHRAACAYTMTKGADVALQKVKLAYKKTRYDQNTAAYRPADGCGV